MYYLSPEEIETVSGRVVGQGINYSHLPDDLTDHICCQIEQKIEGGEEFEKALNQIFIEIGTSKLQEIQDATIFYVKLNLMAMKKLVKILGIISSVLVITGIFMKTMHWPGASMLFFLGFITLLLGFTPFGLWNLKKESELGMGSKRFLVYLVGFICLFEFGLAILFKMMHWPGAGMLVVLSVPLLFLVFFPMLFVQIIKTSDNKIVHLTLLLFCVIFLGMSISSMTNAKTSRANLYNVAIYDMDSSADFYKSRATFIKQNLADTQFSKELVSGFDIRLENAEQSINNLQTRLLGSYNDVQAMNMAFVNKSVGYDEIIGDLRSIRKEIDAYYNFIKMNFSPDVVLDEFIRAKLGVDMKVKVFSGPMGWEQVYYHTNSGNVGRYNNLNNVKKDLWQVHYEVLNSIANKEAS